MSAAWPNGGDVDGMSAFVNETWMKYREFPTWEAMYFSHRDRIIEVMADTCCGVMSVAATLYIVGVEEGDEGPERWLAVGFEMFRRMQRANATVNARGGLGVNAEGKLVAV